MYSTHHTFITVTNKHKTEKLSQPPESNPQSAYLWPGPLLTSPSQHSLSLLAALSYGLQLLLCLGDQLMEQHFPAHQTGLGLNQLRNKHTGCRHGNKPGRDNRRVAIATFVRNERRQLSWKRHPETSGDNSAPHIQRKFPRPLRCSISSGVCYSRHLWRGRSTSQCRAVVYHRQSSPVVGGPPCVFH